MIQTFKIFIMEITGLARDTLHVYAGMAILLLSAAILKKEISSPIPWMIVLAAACGVEALDARDDLLEYGYWRIDASLHDIFNTIFWPGVILIVSRYTNLFRGKNKDAPQ